MAKKQSAPTLSFDDQLVLFRFFLRELGIDSLESLSQNLNTTDYEGVNESGNTYFFEYIAHINRLNGGRVSTDALRRYDENICRHTQKISEKRGVIHWKYFQYLSLLFTEMYLDRYFGDRKGFCKSLNEFLAEQSAKTLGLLAFAPYTPEKMNKLAFMCATGSGKTLIMHVNILQYLQYSQRAARMDSRFLLNKIIVLTPNEGMSHQHLEELQLSSIPAVKFEKAGMLDVPKNAVIVIDVNKLDEDGKIKTVSVDSFEQNNLVLVDEGHRGLSGNVWYDYRTRLSQNGFSFEYSATFKQALNANATGNTDKAKEERALMEEYGKSILMDYSYKYFYRDGYGKDYRIYNLKGSIDAEQRSLYLTGCLLSFYQQMKLYSTAGGSLAAFRIEKPLLVFVGNRVTTATSREELTDVEELLDFIDKFVRDRTTSIVRIKRVLNDDTGLIDDNRKELFYGDFYALQHVFDGALDPAAIFEDILRLVFNTNPGAEEPRLHLENIRQIAGEIGLKIGNDGDYFGVISIGDTAGLIRNCENNGIASRSEEFISESLFRRINERDSAINVLIGSRKFTEGWNSWRVSTMGLINFAKGEGSQAIQLFGRGVRLKGYQGCLKRSSKLDAPFVSAPKDIEMLETLTIFGVRAQYMEDFKKYLELEGAPSNDNIRKFHLRVVRRCDELKGQDLYVIRVKPGANFKKQACRLILDVPKDEGFMRYLLRNKTVIDCRSRIQTIDSRLSMKIESLPEELTLPKDKLAFLDYERIFEELERYKDERSRFNISIVKDKLPEILRVEGWYALLIPRDHLEIDSIPKLEAATDYAIMALKSYMDKFLKYEKDRWESERLEYAALEGKNKNFFDEYVISYARQGKTDHGDEELERIIQETRAALERHRGLDASEETAFRDRLMIFDFKHHLYAPLLCLRNSDLKLRSSPIGLNEGEKKFVDLLKEYVESEPAVLEGRSLHLLRNRSKTGMGFFEAGNFYPDFTLWIDDGSTQYISFIDPKGLLQVGPEDAKIQFYQTIKELQRRLASPAEGKNIVLNSFIMSVTPAPQLRERWQMKKPAREARNVYTLDDPDCVRSMIEKILTSE